MGGFGFWVFASASADGEIRLWDIEKPKPTARIKSVFSKVKGRYRARDATSAILTIECSRAEIVGGSMEGDIYIWWLKTGELMKKFNAHTAPIRKLQFDPTKIISCGDDNVVAISDITTGDVLQRRGGNRGQFDPPPARGSARRQANRRFG